MPSPRLPSSTVFVPPRLVNGVPSIEMVTEYMPACASEPETEKVVSGVNTFDVSSVSILAIVGFVLSTRTPSCLIHSVLLSTLSTARTQAVIIPVCPSGDLS